MPQEIVSISVSTANKEHRLTPTLNKVQSDVLNDFCPHSISMVEHVFTRYYSRRYTLLIPFYFYDATTFSI